MRRATRLGRGNVEVRVVRGDGVRVMIVGAGVAGLATVAALRGWGATVDVVERAPGLTDSGTGIYLGDALKLSLTAPPVDGKANQACIEFFANLLRFLCLPTIASGQNSRNKVVRVAGISLAEIQKETNYLNAGENAGEGARATWSLFEPF